MSTDRCMDAFLDWGRDHGHYDARIVRECDPGNAVGTDPQGDGHWSEPPITPLNGIQRGWGYVIDDDNLRQIDGQRDHMTNTGTIAPTNPAPGTGTQGYARVRTEYQSGAVKSCNPLPATSPDGSGGCTA